MTTMKLEIARIPAPPRLRRMLRPGQRVRVQGLSPSVNGVVGVVVRLVARGDANDPITDAGYWTIEHADGLRREFQRRYLFPVR